MKRKISLLFIALVFILGLAACKPAENPDQKVFDEAYQALNVVYPGGDSTKIIANFTVTTSLRGGVTATWASSNANLAKVVTTAAVTTVEIVRPENGAGNADITLTATVKYNDITDTKEFKFTILEEPAVDAITITGIKTSELSFIDPNGSGTTGPLKDEFVRILNVTVVAEDEDAYWVSDGTDAIMIFESPANVQIGQKGNIIAKVGIYYGAWQLTSTTWSNVTQGSEIQTKEVNLADYWIANKAEPVDNLILAQNNAALSTYVTFEAKIVYRTDFTGGSSYMTTLVDPNSTSNNENFVLVYYKSPEYANIAQYNGLTVRFVATVRELRYNRTTNAAIGARPIFSLSVHSMVIPELTDEDKANLDANTIEILPSYPESATLDLITSGAQGSSITWAYTVADDANNDVISLETGLITPIADKQVKVKITATIENGEAVVKRNYVIAVGNFPISKIGDIITGAADETVKPGDPIRIKGILLGGSTPSAFWLQDATGGINLYVPSELRATFAAYAQGIELDITGSYAIFNGMHEMEKFAANTYSVTNANPAMPKAKDVSNNSFTAEGFDGLQGQRVTFKGFKLKEAVAADLAASANIKFVHPTTDAEFIVRIDSRMPFFNDVRDYLAGFAAGDVVDVKNVVVSWYNGPQLVFVNNPFVETPLSAIADIVAGSANGTIKNNAEIRIKGILLGGSTPSAFWLQDATGGMNLYVPSGLEAAFAEMAHGVELELTGLYELYNGLHEIKEFTYVVINETPALPTAANVSDVALAAEAMLSYQGMLVQFNGFKLKEVVAADLAASANITFVHPTSGAEFIVRIDSRMPFFNDVRDYLASLTTSDVVNVKRVVVGWFNGPQLVFVDNPFATE